MASVTSEKKESTIFIKNLPDDITTGVDLYLLDFLILQQLESSFDEYGPVRRAIIVNVLLIFVFNCQDKNGNSRGFGYVELSGCLCGMMCSVMPEDAEEAAKKLNQKEFFGKIVKVEIAKPKKKGMNECWAVMRREGN